MFRIAARRFCQKVSEGEQRIVDILKSAFPSGAVNVADVSGGCGSMYQVHVVDTKFKGLPLVKQHQLVSQALKSEIKDMHGIRIATEVPKS